MRNSSLLKVFVAVLAGLMASAPVYATCTAPGCVIGPCICFDNAVDGSFTNNCTNWSWSGAAARGFDGSDYYAELDGSGYVQQALYVPIDQQDIEISADFQADYSSAGSERVAVALYNSSGSLLQTLGNVYPSTATGVKQYDVTGYGGQTIYVRFRYVSGFAPGDTVFFVDSVRFWTCYS